MTRHTSLGCNALNDMVLTILDASATLVVNGSTGVGVYNKVVGVVVNMDILREDHNFISIAEDSCDFLQWDAFSLWEPDKGTDSSETGDDNEDQEEFPADVGESGGGDLEIDQIGQRDDTDRHGDTFRTEVVWEDLAVEDDTCNINTASV